MHIKRHELSLDNFKPFKKKTLNKRFYRNKIIIMASTTLDFEHRIELIHSKDRTTFGSARLKIN